MIKWKLKVFKSQLAILTKECKEKNPGIDANK